MNKKIYIKPVVNRVILDYAISLQMLSAPKPPPPRETGQSNPSSDPFASPFDDKSFN